MPLSATISLCLDDSSVYPCAQVNSNRLAVPAVDHATSCASLIMQ